MTAIEEKRMSNNPEDTDGRVKLHLLESYPVDNQVRHAPVPFVTDIDGLAAYLLISKETALKIWREIPHIRVTHGSDARGARFILADVIEYLRQQGANYDSMEGEERLVPRPVDIQVHVEGPTVQTRRIQDQTGSSKGRNRTSKKKS